MTNRDKSQSIAPRFARILLTLGSGASGWLVVTFVSGVSALGIVSNLIYDFAFNPAGVPLAALLRTLALAAGLIVLAYVTFRLDLRRALRGVVTTIDEERSAPAHEGLIWLLSPVGLELPLFALRYHHEAQGETRLQHCWMLVTSDAQNNFAVLRERVDELGLDVMLHEVTLDSDSIEATYGAVDDVYAAQVQKVGLEAEQVIADLTGGLKTMTAGMVLACLPFGHGRKLEYVESDRDPVSGQPVAGTQHVVLVSLDFATSHIKMRIADSEAIS